VIYVGLATRRTCRRCDHRRRRERVADARGDARHSPTSPVSRRRRTPKASDRLDAGSCRFDADNHPPYAQPGARRTQPSCRSRRSPDAAMATTTSSLLARPNAPCAH